MDPYEIIVGPLTLWLAPVGTAFPLIDVAPAVAWVKVGTSGDENYTEDGVKVSHNQTIDQVRSLGSTGPRKATRGSEDLMIGVTIMDLTLEQYLYGLNGNTVTTTAAGTGTAGFKKVGLRRGLSVARHALLVRGVSAYNEAMSAQYEVPICYQSASPSLTYSKRGAAGIDLEFTALEDASASSDVERFGRLIMQHQAAL